MQFYSDLSKKGAFGAKSVWQEGIHHEGGSQMKHLVDLMNSVDFINGTSANNLLLSQQGEKYEYLSIFAGEDYVFCYDYSGNEFTIDVTDYNHSKSAYWFDPVCGTYSFICDLEGKSSLQVKPVKREDGSNDFVCVIK